MLADLRAGFAQLRQHGYAVIDNVMTAERSEALREEIAWLMQEGKMQPNKVQFTIPDKQPIVVTKPNIFEVRTFQPYPYRHFPMS